MTARGRNRRANSQQDNARLLGTRTRTQEKYHSQHLLLLLKRDENTDRRVEKVVARKLPELVHGCIVDETDGARRVLYVLRFTEFGWSSDTTQRGKEKQYSAGASELAIAGACSTKGARPERQSVEPCRPVFGG